MLVMDGDIENVTMVLGASPNPARYSYTAVLKLLAGGHRVVPVGIREGTIGPLNILTGMPALEAVDTVTMYVGAKHQATYEDYLLSLNPRRIIFNPGAENPAFAKRATEAGIEVEQACTLVLLSTNQY